MVWRVGSLNRPVGQHWTHRLCRIIPPDMFSSLEPRAYTAGTSKVRIPINDMQSLTFHLLGSKERLRKVKFPIFISSHWPLTGGPLFSSASLSLQRIHSHHKAQSSESSYCSRRIHAFPVGGHGGTGWNVANSKGDGKTDIKFGCQF
jgi:hypothetical protein